MPSCQCEFLSADPIQTLHLQYRIQCPLAVLVANCSVVDIHAPDDPEVDIVGKCRVVLAHLYYDVTVDVDHAALLPTATCTDMAVLCLSVRPIRQIFCRRQL